LRVNFEAPFVILQGRFHPTCCFASPSSAQA